MLMEFKVGAVRFDRSSRWQTEQYALDLRDFHKASHEKSIVPFLIATEADSPTPRPGSTGAKRKTSVYCVSPAELAATSAAVYQDHTDGATLPVDVAEWDDSPYQPTPSIVAAAQDIFQKHDLSDIKVADSYNLDSTVDSVFDLVEFCKSNQRHGIAFITGAPGSGKTLAGLQVIHHHKLVDSQGSAGVFVRKNASRRCHSKSLVDRRDTAQGR
jgi:hypothetical protein